MRIRAAITLLPGRRVQPLAAASDPLAARSGPHIEHCHPLLTRHGCRPSAWRCDGQWMPSLGARNAPSFFSLPASGECPGAGSDPDNGAATGAPHRALPHPPPTRMSPLGVAMQRAADARFRGMERPGLTTAPGLVQADQCGPGRASAAARQRALPHPPPTRMSPLGVAMQRAADARFRGRERPTPTAVAGRMAGRRAPSRVRSGAHYRALPPPPDRIWISPLGVALRLALDASLRGRERPGPDTASVAPGRAARRMQSLCTRGPRPIVPPSTATFP